MGFGFFGEVKKESKRRKECLAGKDLPTKVIMKERRVKKEMKFILCLGCQRRVPCEDWVESS